MPEDLNPIQKRIASLTLAVVSWVIFVLLLIVANYVLGKANAGLEGDSSGNLMAPLGILILVIAFVVLMLAIASTLAAIAVRRNNQAKPVDSVVPSSITEDPKKPPSIKQ